MPSKPASDLESLFEEARHHIQSAEKGSTNSVGLTARANSVVLGPQRFPNIVERLTETKKNSSNQVNEKIFLRSACIKLYSDS